MHIGADIMKDLVERRRLLRGTLNLGALSPPGGCDISDSDAVQKMLAIMSRWNDDVEAALFSGTKLAPEFAENLAVKDFRYNAYYPKQKAPVLKAEDDRLELSGLLADKRPWTVDQLHALPQKSQVTRHICVEG
jgi:DMSO/TMAO reductase YedYZ molybdopterin-dependent catalytic subunit